MRRTAYGTRQKDLEEGEGSLKEDLLMGKVVEWDKY